MKEMTRQLRDFLLCTEASTRTSALLRIALIAVLWSKWANMIIVPHHMQDGFWPFSIVFGIASSLAFFGLWTRFAVALTASCALYLVHYAGYGLGMRTFLHHHTNLLVWCLVWLVFTPCGTSLSVDRWLAVRRAERLGAPPPPERGNVWGLRLIALQVSALYFWTGLHKLHFGFLSGARLAQMAMELYLGSSPVRETPGLWPFFKVLGPSVAFTELALAFGLWNARLRTWLIPIGVVMHGLFYMLVSVSTFSVTMWIAYLAFLDPEATHAQIDRLLGRPRPRSGADSGDPSV